MPKSIRTSRYLIAIDPEKEDCGQDIENVNEEDEPAADRSQDGAAVGLSWWDYAKTLLALLFVVGLLLALLKFINRKNRMFDQHRLMKNVGGLSLGTTEIHSIGRYRWILLPNWCRRRSKAIERDYRSKRD